MKEKEEEEEYIYALYKSSDGFCCGCGQPTLDVMTGGLVQMSK